MLGHLTLDVHRGDPIAHEPGGLSLDGKLDELVLHQRIVKQTAMIALRGVAMC